MKRLPFLRLAAATAIVAALAACHDGTSGPVPDALTVVSGGNQTGTAGAPLPALVVVQVTDNGTPVSGAQVTWAVATGGGSTSSTTTTTGPDGRTSVQWTLGGTAGAQTITATVAGVAPVTISATAQAGAAAKVRISPDSARLNAFTRRKTFDATVTDAFGNPVTAPFGVTFMSLDESVATIGATTGTSGEAVAVGNGTARIVATIGSASDTALVTVQQVLASVTLRADSVAVGDTVRALALDSAGQTIASGITWGVSDSTKASINASGLVTGVAAGTVQVVAKLGAQTAQAALTVVQRQPFVALATAYGMDAGARHTCAWTSSGNLYCWGDNSSGQLGIGVVPTAGDAMRTLPVKILSLSTNDAVFAGGAHSCATAGRNPWLYCWGSDQYGQLGDNLSAPFTCLAGERCRVSPTQITQDFYVVTLGDRHSCKWTFSPACWGSNDNGQLGTNTGDRPVPTALAGGPASFSQISAGGTLTCGIDGAGSLYCWGTAPIWGRHDTPTQVAAGTTFTDVTVGGSFACAIATSGTTYCFGDNAAGQLGVGHFSAAEAYGPVSGGPVFTDIDAGNDFICGTTAGGTAYCWGAVAVTNGVAGSGCSGGRCVTTPQAEPGGLTFTKIAAGGGEYRATGTVRGHVCGVQTTTGQLFCWGMNEHGELGTGNTTPATSPQLVRYSP